MQFKSFEECVYLFTRFYTLAVF